MNNALKDFLKGKNVISTKELSKKGKDNQKNKRAEDTPTFWSQEAKSFTQEELDSILGMKYKKHNNL